jgi:LmbE family N-acetylglucosaminyl deacetylase
MGEVRTDELLRSLEVLGVKEHHFLEGPVDIDMQTPLDPAGADQVRRIMEDVDPDTVLTFGPEGMTGHVGHQDVSRWTGQAFEEVAKPGARLYHTVFPKSLADEWLEELAPFNIFLPGTPLIVPDDELDISLELPPDLLDRKVRSLKEHASQIEGLLEVFGDDGLGRFLGKESFVLAAEKES